MAERFVVRANDLGFEPVDDEMLVIDFITSDYYILNVTGSAVWNALAKPRTADELAAAYGSDADARDAIRNDLDSFLAALVADGLVVATDDGGDGMAVPSLESAYVVPRFEKFGTLERLMLAGE